MTTPYFDLRGAIIALLIGLPAGAQAGLALSDLPLFLTTGVAPNVVMTLDDSGSMARGYVPDTIGASSSKVNGPQFTAASYNALYYNPRTVYTIPLRTDGVTYTTSFTSAYVNGFDTSRGATDLSRSGYRPVSECPPDTLVGNCSFAAGAGTGGTRTTVTFRYTGCDVTFDDRGGNTRDRLQISGCAPTLPASGVGSPQNADSAVIIVSGAGSFSGDYRIATASSSGGGVRVDLATSNQITRDNTASGVTLQWSVTTTTPSSPAPGYYHLYYTDKPGAPKPAACTSSVEDSSCYVLVLVGSADDVAAGDAVARKRNFAIWYSFYRTRALATMSGAMNAVTRLGTNQVRLGWQSLNSQGCASFGTTCTGYSGNTHENRIRTLDALKNGSATVTHRTDFYNWVARMNVGGGTPLRKAMDSAGQYFSTAGLNSPYAQEPYKTLGTELSCRRNFHVMMTDGLWNGNANTDFGGNIDSAARTMPDGTTYTPRYPFRNPPTAPPTGMSYSNSLADIAFRYWASDLRGAGGSPLANNLTPYVVDRSGTVADQYWNPANNPATWQHMVNFTISFGLGSVLTEPQWRGSTFAGDYPALASGTKFWPAVDESPSGDPPEHVYDLWHAAINSRGQFFNADDPLAIGNAFQSVFSSILAANPSSTALAANSGSAQEGTLLFQARFDSTDWHGELLAYGVNADGALSSAIWDAGTRLPDPSARNITTWNGTAGTELRNCATQLTGSQRSALDATPGGTVDNGCQSRLDWLRGTNALEQRNGGSYRNRKTSVLGDIVNSDPLWVKAEDYGYANASVPGRSSYVAYVASKADRIPMIYVGANDGMLHGFRADIGSTTSGRELMAHVPAVVFDRLNRLMDPSYGHASYVDGQLAAGDAYIGGNWKTVLVGGLGAGGRSIYAIDISDPLGHGPSKVMWEFTDPDLGYTFSQPQIGHLRSGHWVAVFGNGYNSATTNEKAWLFVVDLSNGTLLRKIQAGGPAAVNGLSTPALIDTNGDRILDYAYAGDLQGNLWKFDLTGDAPSAWGLANGGLKLIQAVNAAGGGQPITVKPSLAIATKLAAGGVMVYFGSGQYLNSTDIDNTAVQTFYAVWDNGAPGTVTRSQLRSQTIDAETRQFGYDLRQTSNNTVDYATQRGWFVDLQLAGSGANGERVIAPALLRYDRVIFMTTIPSRDVCVAGGSSWLMELDAYNGARGAPSFFDLNLDGAYTAADLLASGNAASGVKSPIGIARTPVWLEQGRSSETAFKQLSGSTGGTFALRNRKPAILGSVRRVFWQQIQ